MWYEVQGSGQSFSTATLCFERTIVPTFFFFFNLTYSRWTSSLPSCLWSQRIFPSLPGSRLTLFLSRCKFSTLTTRQPMVEFYLLAFPRFPLRKKEHKSYFGKNRTHDFRTSRCAGYLLDHSGGLTHIYLCFFLRRCVLRCYHIIFIGLVDNLVGQPTQFKYSVQYNTYGTVPGSLLGDARPSNASPRPIFPLIPLEPSSTAGEA